MPARYRVEITKTAETDLDHICAHISADSVVNATQFALQFEQHLATLERMPLRCPEIPENELIGTHYRHLIVGPYRVIFRVEASTVFILRVVHGNRFLDAPFLNPG